MSCFHIRRAISKHMAPFSAGLSVCLLASIGGLPVATHAQPVASPLHYATSQPIGNLPGSFGVDGNGSATWALQIKVPPGTAGAAPSLQVTYDSHRSNGYLGMGFALNGIAAITRCGANYRTDGYKSAVEYNARDRFCLDGRRLIAVSGQYGADGTVYHTAIETWTVLTSHGVCGTGPCWFSGTDKDGNTLSFGATTGSSGSRILAQGRTDGAVRTWSIDSRTDLNGNTSTVSYVNDVAAGEYYPSRISYTSNPAAGLEALRSVQFDYGDRTDVIRRFIGGSQVQISKLLTAITTTVSSNGSPRSILAYKFAYANSPSSGRSRLQSVTMCDANHACLPPSTFDWYTNEMAFAPATNQLPGPTYVILDDRLYPFGILMDLNGDGIADYSKAAEFVDGQRDLAIYLGHADGSFTKTSYSLPGPIWRITSDAVVQTGLLRDINGDGIVDYSAALRNDDAGSSDLAVYLGTSHGFDKQPGYQLPGEVFWQVNGHTMKSGVLADMNGDGLPDYSRATVLPATGQRILDIYKGTGSGFVKTGTALPGPLYSVDANGSREVGILRDINGDGINDFSAATVNADAGTQDLRVFLGLSPTFTFTHAYDLPGQMIWVVNGASLESGALVDINGDGIPDYSRATHLESTGQQLLDVHLGTGGGFTASEFQLPGPLYSVLDNQSYVQGLLTNWNGDGTTRYSRATRRRDGTEDLSLYLGSGTGFHATGKSLPKAMFQILDDGTYANAEYQDINGDGNTDFIDSVCGLSDDGSFTHCSLDIQLAQGPFPDLLKSISNGFGGSTSIEYSALSAMDVPSVASSYPIRNADSSQIVVSAYATSDGRGHSYRYTYAYAGGRVDVLGHGWLGFKSVTMTDVAGERSTKATYDQSYPFAGVVLSSQVLDGEGKVLAQNVYTYDDNASQEMQQIGVHQPLRDSETFTQYTGDSADYSLQTKYAYDAYGNTTMTSRLGDVADPQDDVYTCTRYFNDAATGRYGYQEQSKIDRTLQGCSNFLAASNPGDMTWDPAVDLRWSKTGYDARMNVTTKSQYDDGNSVFLTDTFAFDAYGNIISATNAAGDTTTFTYDSTYHTFRETITSPELSRGNATYTLTTKTAYDPGFGTLLSTTDPNGNVTTQDIDGFGRPVAVYGPDDTGHPTLLVATKWAAANGTYYLETRQRPSWDNDDQSTWYWDRQYYDGLDRIYHTERSGIRNGSPATIATDTGFDPEGRIHTTTAPYYLGDAAPTTTIAYDIYNRPVLSTDPAGVQNKIDYADGGRKITRTHAYGTPDAQTRITYLDGRGLVLQTVAPNGATTAYARNPLGAITSVTTAPEVRTTTTAYDSLGRKRRVENSNTGVSTWTYSATGALAQTTDGAGNTVTYAAYDAMGRLRERAMSYHGGTASTTYVYDDPTYANGLGNLTGVQMTRGSVGSFAYTYGYNAYGQAKAGTMTIAGDQYAYGSTYDPLGRIVSATYPTGDKLILGYLTDRALGTVSMTPSGQSQSTRYATYANYTALGQAQKTAYNVPGINVATTYFPVGESFAQLRTATATRGGDTLYSRNYSWNKLNALTAIADQQNASANQAYGYDNQPSNAHMGFLTHATGAYDTQDYAYDALGNVSQKNNVVMTYATGKDWLTSTSAGTTFAYASNGNLKTETGGDASTSYTYDSGGLLVQTDKSKDGTTQSGYAAYDASGRRVFHQRVGETRKTYYITRQFEVVDFGDGRFQHTEYVPGTVTPIAAITSAGKGNTLSIATEHALSQLYSTHGVKGSVLHAWHAAIAMAGRYALPFGASFALAWLGFMYIRLKRMWRQDDHAHMRPAVAMTTPLVVLCFLLYTVTPAYASLTPGANGAGIPTTGQVFFLPNQLQSTMLVTDASGAVTATVAYLPDGSINQSHSSGIDNFRPKFAGSEWDPTTALYHMGVRYYSPSLGRFTSPDPAGQFTSPYLYAGNNPVSAIDPDGRFAVAIAVAVIVGAVAGSYFGGAVINHDMNPLNWNWRSGKTYAGLVGGAAIGAVGAAAGGAAIEAGVAIGGLGGLAAQAAGVAVGIGGQVLVGAGENAAFTALGGGSTKEVLQSAGEGALWGAAFAVGGEAVGGLAARFGRRTGSAVDSAEGVVGPASKRRTSAAGEVAGEVCSASFIADTPVIGADGKPRPIQRVKVGDKLAGRDMATHTNANGEVAKLVRRQTRTFVEIKLADGNSITTTPRHAFRGYKRGWIQAKDLGAGSLLVGTHGKPVEVASTVKQQADKPVTVYNFEVAGTHTYRVGRDGVLVHNPKKVGVCRARIDAYGVVTEEWNTTELQRRFPKKADYQAIQRDIRAKARNANKIINKNNTKAWTRVSKPVTTASKQWVRYAWKKKFGTTPPTSIRQALAKLRTHFANQDVDEYLTRIQGGLTIREGVPENQGPLNSFVNQTSGAAMGALSRASKPKRIYRIRASFIKF